MALSLPTDAPGGDRALGTKVAKATLSRHKMPVQTTPTPYQRLIPRCHMHIDKCAITVLPARRPSQLGALLITSHADKPHGVQRHFRLRKSS